MKPAVSFLSILVPFFLLCGYGIDKYDRDNPDYVSPTFTIDNDQTTITGSNDTTTADTVALCVKGNDSDHRNQFRFSLDEGTWSSWEGDRHREHFIKLYGLASGTHSVKIQVCYHPDNGDFYDTTITFFQARKPEIVAMTEMLFDADAGEPCTLWVKAEGTGELTYAWYRDTTRIDSSTTDSLILKNVSIADTAPVWYCRVTSDWGDTQSNEIRLHVLFHVTYDGNNHTGGEVPDDTNSYETGEIVTVLGNTGDLVRGGYTFDGWNTKNDGTGTDRDSGEIFKIMADNIILYVRWNANPSFTLAYDRNGATGGSVPDVDLEYKTGEPVTILGNSGKLVKSGYTFLGWNSKSDGSGTDYDTGTTIIMGDEYFKLYAKWEIIRYTVQFDSRGGTAVDDTIINQGTLLTRPADPVWSGYTFLAWYRDSLYTSSWVFANNVTSDMTLYAKWVVKDADGNIYTTVTIGNQVWMVENLKTERYNDGTTIPPVADSATWNGLGSAAFCWYDNDDDNKNTYGALYNWYAVATGKCAPKGWHVATDAEWDTLISKLGGETEAGGKLKEAGTDHWDSPNTGATNESGLSALPGGYRRSNTSNYTGKGTMGCWWSSSENTATSAWYRSLSHTTAAINRGSVDKKQGYSVRCVRNELFFRPVIPDIHIQLSPLIDP